ncbi:MAG TPA: choline dehydrogenase, partial [Hyphomonadaceae bacterium]|nr:choline dehydrogenase [Hyphomonadaceae bacterium]
GEPLYEAFIEAGKSSGYPYTPDFNGAQQEGVGPYQLTIHDGERWSASFAYLRPALERPNLTVISTGRVTKVLVENGKAIGVEYVAGKRGVPEQVYADAEVLVCAGAVQSPQILQLSGLGKADDLRAQGIDVKADLPGVGANLQDHLDISMVYKCSQKITAYSKQSGIKKLFVGLNYMLRKQGPGRDNFLQAGGVPLFPP